jgi:hypothetical protein
MRNTILGLLATLGLFMMAAGAIGAARDKAAVRGANATNMHRLPASAMTCPPRHRLDRTDGGSQPTTSAQIRGIVPANRATHYETETCKDGCYSRESRC